MLQKGRKEEDKASRDGMTVDARRSVIAQLAAAISQGLATAVAQATAGRSWLATAAGPCLAVLAPFSRFDLYLKRIFETFWDSFGRFLD